MGFLTDMQPDFIRVGKYRFRVHAAYDVILDIQHLYQEEGLTDYEKLMQALSMLVRNPRNLSRLKPEEKAKLLNEIYAQYVRVPSRGRKRAGPPVLDFDLDGEYIFASFLQDYGIDLIDARGRLSWKQFLALFQGLSDDTKIKQVIHIRSMDIPAATRYNQNQIQQIQELKSYYALPVKGGGGREGLDALWGALEGMAVKQHSDTK